MFQHDLLILVRWDKTWLLSWRQMPKYNKWKLSCNNVVCIKNTSNCFLNDFLHVGLQGSQRITSESSSFSKWGNGGKSLGQHSFFSDTWAHPLGLQLTGHRFGRQKNRAEVALLKSGSSSVRSRPPPHALPDHLPASHLPLGFSGQEVRFQYYLWLHIQGKRSKFFHYSMIRLF